MVTEAGKGRRSLSTPAAFTSLLRALRQRQQVVRHIPVSFGLEVLAAVMRGDYHPNGAPADANKIAARVAFDVADCDVFLVFPACAVHDTADGLDALVGVGMAPTLIDAHDLLGHCFSPSNACAPRLGVGDRKADQLDEGTTLAQILGCGGQAAGPTVCLATEAGGPSPAFFFSVASSTITIAPLGHDCQGQRPPRRASTGNGWTLRRMSDAPRAWTDESQPDIAGVET